MHFAVLVVAKSREKADIEVVLTPYREIHWDWFQIGGRFTGIFDGYDPETDPVNIEECTTCNGTGIRPGGREEFGEEWFREMKGCNGCLGAGRRARWATAWAPHEGDSIPLEHLTPAHYEHFYAVCCAEGWFGGETYIPWAEPKFQKQELPPLDWLKRECPNHVAVVVDCHN